MGEGLKKASPTGEKKLFRERDLYEVDLALRSR